MKGEEEEEETQGYFGRVLVRKGKERE